MIGEPEMIQKLQRAAEQGDAEAQLSLGIAYRFRQGVLQDCKEGLNWYRKSAEQGGVIAQHRLGYAYEVGEGVPKNTATVYAWYNVATANGSFLAPGARDRVAKEMTAEQIAEGQKLSTEWFEKYQPKDK